MISNQGKELEVGTGRREGVRLEVMAGPAGVLYKLVFLEALLNTSSLLITTHLQRMLVWYDFPKTLYEKFINFFQSISLPCHCFGFSNSLNVVPWDHVLLTTVLKGQNITGQRTRKGRKVFLWEALPVIEARVEKLVDKKKLRDLRDKIPFYLCKTGDFLDAAHSLLFPINSLSCCTACRITPLQFEVYLKMFRTGSVPTGTDMLDSGPWITVGKCDFLLTYV
ncbi:uncharacterized protein RG961_008710 [Leptosomus discolor]